MLIFATMPCKYCKKLADDYPDEFDIIGEFKVMKYDDGHYYRQCTECDIFGGYYATLEEALVAFNNSDAD